MEGQEGQEGQRKRQCLWPIGSSSETIVYESNCATESHIESFDVEDIDEDQVCLGLVRNNNSSITSHSDQINSTNKKSKRSPRHFKCP